MFASVFHQIGSVLVLYLPIRTTQNIIDCGIIKDYNDLLTPALRYQLYTDKDQMQQRLNQFMQSKEYFQSMPQHVTTYQIWEIVLYDSFTDKEVNHITNTNILDVVSIKKILSFCLLPQAEYFTTVQSKHDGMLQKINIWTKPQQINEYMNEIINANKQIYYNHAKYDEKTWSEACDKKEDELFQFEHNTTRSGIWRTVCHAMWNSESLDAIMHKTAQHKSRFQKAKYMDWKSDHNASFDVEFCNFYYDDNDNIIGNYYESLRNILCVSDFAESMIKRWYAIDIETKGVGIRLTIINSNLLCGLLQMKKEIILKKSNAKISDEMEAAQQNKTIVIGEKVKKHIVMYKFQFIVWKARYKLKDIINAELDELECMEMNELV